MIFLIIRFQLILDNTALFIYFVALLLPMRWRSLCDNVIVRPSVTRRYCITRKLCYRKDDRTMRPTYGCPENFRDCLTTPTATIPNIFMEFWSDRLYECSYKI